MCWAQAGPKVVPQEKVWQISKGFGGIIAALMLVSSYAYMLFGSGSRMQPSLTATRVKYVCMTRYFNIDKAKRRLGYRPLVKLDDGVRSAVKFAVENGLVPGSPENLALKREQ